MDSELGDEAQYTNILEECRYFLKRLPDWPHKRFIPVHVEESGIHAHLQLGVTPDIVLERFGLDQYLYIDGRGRPVAETVTEIGMRLESRPSFRRRFDLIR